MKVVGSTVAHCRRRRVDVSVYVCVCVCETKLYCTSLHAEEWAVALGHLVGLLPCPVNHHQLVK